MAHDLSHLALPHRPAYIVGGAVRDLLLGRPLHDVDLAVEGDPLEAAAELARQLGGSVVPLKGLARVATTHLQVDITRLSGPIEEDLRRRDYTINAMAAPLLAAAQGDLCIIDPLGGQEDLRRGIVRLASPDALAADPVRLLRGPRLALELGFQLDGGTAQAIREEAALLGRAAPERLAEELRRILHLPGGGRGMALLHELGLLTQLFPELQEAEGVEQPHPHQLDVLGHLLEASRWVDVLLGHAVMAEELGVRQDTAALLTPEVVAYLQEEATPGWQRAALLRLGALLHDVGKPRTRLALSGRIHFYGHDRVGAEMAGAMLARLRLPTRAIAFTTALVREHMRPVQMAMGPGLPSRRAAYRLHRDAGDAGPAVALLFVADTLATSGPNDRARLARALEVASHLLRLAHEGASQPPRLVSGHDIMAALGVGPGPLVGRLLRAIEEAAAAGEVSAREEALELARRLAGEARDQ